jgi:predicted SprT family Zn-dependent metalloprotease
MTPADEEDGMTDDEVRAIIEETQARLPQAIQAVVDHECHFLVYRQGTHGLALHRDRLQDKPWLLVIEASVDAADAHGVVAHEIAHAWLGHRYGGSADEESAAPELAATWGFTGSGAGWPEDDAEP